MPCCGLPMAAPCSHCLSLLVAHVRTCFAPGHVYHACCCSSVPADLLPCPTPAPRMSYIHCDPKSCPCGSDCSNQPFYRVKGPKLETFLTEDRGYGVRCSQPLKKGEQCQGLLCAACMMNAADGNGAMLAAGLSL